MGKGNGRVLGLGAGSAGEHFVGALRRLDPEVEIVVERELAGGARSYSDQGAELVRGEASVRAGVRG